jgi:hypothetical protein
MIKESVNIIEGSILLPSVQLWLTCTVQHCSLNVYIFEVLTICEISIQIIHNSTVGLRRTKRTVINVALKKVYSLVTKHLGGDGVERRKMRTYNLLDKYLS